MINMNKKLTDEQQLDIARRFIAHAPPGELNEVFNDVRVLLNNDALVRRSLSQALAEYNRKQYVPITIQNSQEKCLITDTNDLGDGRFYDPRTKRSFKFDHLRCEAYDYRIYQIDNRLELWRSPYEKEFTEYVHKRYPFGSCSIFGQNDVNRIILTAFIESHKFEPNNFWNGRWRSKWSFSIRKDQNRCELNGVLKIQVHYFEDGNVQLVSCKDIKESIQIQNQIKTIKDIIQVMSQSEDDYQKAVNENYQAMSESTFKALRRQLPITKTKIDWGKITSYKIGSELKHT